MEVEECGAPSIQDPARSGVAAELLAKHSRSQQPESQQLCLILNAVLEVLQSEGMEPTPTALFAAVMSSLEKAETQASAQARSSTVLLGEACKPILNLCPNLSPCEVIIPL
jgi:hypothetical protein